MKITEPEEEEISYSKLLSKPPLRPDQRWFRAGAVAIIVAMLGGAAMLPVAAPSGFPTLSLCVFKSATGLPCPLCGGTRAAQAVLRGNFSRARYLNAAAFPAVAIIVTIALALAGEALSGRAANWGIFFRRLRPLLPVMAGLLCIYWIVHIASALRGPKPELVDLGNPLAQAIRERVSARPQ